MYLISMFVAVTSLLPGLLMASTHSSSGDEAFDILTPDMGSSDDFLNYPLPNPGRTNDMTLESLVKHLEGQVRESQTSQARTRSVLLVLQEKLEIQERDIANIKNDIRLLQRAQHEDHTLLMTVNGIVSDSNWAMADLKHSQNRLHHDLQAIKLEQDQTNGTVIFLEEWSRESQSEQVEIQITLHEMQDDLTRLSADRQTDRQLLHSLIQTRVGLESGETSGDGSHEDRVRSHHEEKNNAIEHNLPQYANRVDGYRQQNSVVQEEAIARLNALCYNLTQQVAELEKKLHNYERKEGDMHMNGLQQAFTNFTQQMVKLEEMHNPSQFRMNHTMNQIPQITSTVDNHHARISMLENLVLEYREGYLRDFTHKTRDLQHMNQTMSHVNTELRQLSRDSARSLLKLKDQLLQSSSQILYMRESLHQMDMQLANQSMAQCGKDGADHRQDATLIKFEINMESIDRKVGAQQDNLERLDRGVSRLSSSVDDHGSSLDEMMQNDEMMLHLLPATAQLQHEISNLVWQLPPDCSHISTNGAALLRPTRSGITTRAYCIHDKEGDWTVIQRRINGSLSFARDWTDYRMGFGDANHEFWLGNENLHYLTTQSDYLLHLDMWDLNGRHTYAQYSYFKVDEETANYRLHVDGYSGNATDALSYSNFMPFSTQDRDNDASSTHCAKFYTAGWWYKHCHYGNLNGRYALGIVWFNHEIDEWVQLGRVVMKIRLANHRDNSVSLEQNRVE